MDKPKILLIDNSIALTGAFRSIRIFTKELAGTYEFIFAIPTGANTKELLDRDKTKSIQRSFIELQRSWKVLLYFPFLIYNAFSLLRFCRREGIKVVHVNDLFNMCGLVMKLFRPSVKIIYHIRLMPDSYVRKFYSTWVNLISARADVIICVSQAVFRALPDGPKKAVIYDSIVKDSPWQPKESTRAKGLQLLYLANYIPGKGQDHAIAAYKVVVEKFPESKLVFAGGDMGLEQNRKYKASLRSYAAVNKLDHHVELRGFAENPEPLLRESDIVLNFSASESFSLTCLEALHWGTPLIATDSGGPGELIIHGRTGLLIRVGDIVGMTEAIITLCGDEKLRTEFSQQGVKHAQEKFSLPAAVHQLDEIYQRLLIP